MALLSRQLNPNRSFALDAFRGLTMATMILVSEPGGQLNYPPLEHAAWNGWTPTDLIFPSFAFAIGVALMYSLANRRARTTWAGLSLFDWITPILLVIKYIIRLDALTDSFKHAPAFDGYDIFLLATLTLLVLLPRLEKKAIARGGSLPLEVIHHGFLLFALGFTWSFRAERIHDFRVFAVLPRLGLVYIAAGLIVLFNKRRGQMLWVAGLLAFYWIVMKVAPVPGFGAGVLTMEGNFAGYVDRLILGAAHLYAPQPNPYWDPEGILGTIPAIATALLGAIAGGWLRADKTLGERMAGISVAGTLLLVAGLVLDPLFPINKNLWSPTYVLFVAGVDCLTLGVALWFVDFKGVRSWVYPFIVLGSNSILIYLLSGEIRHYAGDIGAGTFEGKAISVWDAVYYHGFASWLSPMNASLAMALVYVSCWIGVAALLYRKKIFIKI